MNRLLRRLAPWLGCLLLAVVAVGANPIRETSTPLDLLAANPGWGMDLPLGQVRNRERSDAIDARLPQWEFSKREIRSGRMPLWNPTSAGGDAALLKLTSGQLTPAFVLFVAVDDSALGFYLSVIFNLTLAGVGMYFFLRKWVDPLPAFFGAVMFEFSGFIAAWLYWSHTLTLMWLPWLLWSLEETLSRRRPAPFALAAAFTALLLLGGFPFVAQLSLGAAALYVLVRTLSSLSDDPGRQRGGALALAAGPALTGAAVLAGFLLAAVPIMTFMQWLAQFPLDHRPSGSPLAIASDWKRMFYPWALGGVQVEKSLYCGTLGTLLALAGFLVTPVRSGIRRSISLYALLLFCVAMVLTFELVPRSQLSWVPGLAFNGWSRAASLLGVALSISSALFLQKASTPFKGPLSGSIAVVIALGLVLQAGDQINYFRKFNGATEASYFYPRTPVLDYVRSRAGNFDYVIADRSYLYSGSLGGYGIREWFAHRFRTPALKRALAEMASDPFNSPTSSRLRLAQVRMGNPWMNYFNVRYILASTSEEPSLSLRGSLVDNPKRIPLGDLAAGPVLQPVDVPSAASVAVDVRFATYQASDVDGRLDVALMTRGGEIVARTGRDASEARDNEFLRFGFDEGLEPGRYVMSIRYTPGRNGRRLTVWTGKAAKGGEDATFNGTALPRSLDYRVVAFRRELGFTKVFADDAVTVWENANSPNGPYFLSRLDDGGHGSLPRSDTVHLRSYEPTGFEIRYEGAEPGYVVVPMELTADWRVSSGGSDIEPKRFLGVLPAIEVSGPTTIRFHYEPRPLRTWWLWCASLMMLAVWLIWAVGSRFRRRKEEGVFES